MVKPPSDRGHRCLLPVGAFDIVAGERATTIITVSPPNPVKAVDRRGADETTVEFDGRRMSIKGPRPGSAASARPARAT